MVNGASGVLGRALIPRLRLRDEVRATVRRPEAAESLRALGAKVAVGRTNDAEALAEILPRVVTLIHLVGGPHQVDDDAILEANHASTLRAISAAKAARVPRFVLASVPGASPEAQDPFLRAKGLAEEAVATSGLDYAILRVSHIYGIGGLWFTAVVQGVLADPPVAIGGDDAVAPVLVDDVAAVLAAAEARPGTLDQTWALEGPDAISPRAFARMMVGEVAASPEPLRDATPGAMARLESLLDVALVPSAVRYLLDPSRADAPDAAAAFGVDRTPLANGIRRTLEHAATTDPAR
jgi:Nucleoside-diphosphate-sugar epimerases